MTANGNRSRVVVIDPLKLRQAGLVRFLETWAETHNFEIVATATPEDRSVWAGCAMVVLNIGGASITDGPPQFWIKSVKTFMADVPIVILSDCEDRGDIRAAFRAGVSGFIPTTLEPALAIEALTFLSRGGSFFPCSVLLEESQAMHADMSRAPDRLPPPAFERPGAETVEYSIVGPHNEAVTRAGGSNGASIHRREYAQVRRTQVRIATRARLWDAPPDRPADMEAEADGAPSLTPRQGEVLQKLSEGKSNKLIARDLEMTEATVKVHVRQIMRKFGATNRTQAALLAMRFSSPAMSRRVR